jgi:hypothetical protein
LYARAALQRRDFAASEGNAPHLARRGAHAPSVGRPTLHPQRPTPALRGPTRLAYRDLIKQTVRDIVRQPQADVLHCIDAATQAVPSAVRAMVHALVVQEMQRLHEGTLARYGLRPSELIAWHTAQAAR